MIINWSVRVEIKNVRLLVGNGTTARGRANSHGEHLEWKSVAELLWKGSKVGSESEAQVGRRRCFQELFTSGTRQERTAIY